MLGEWFKARVAELKEGLQELQERAELERGDGPIPGRSRAGPRRSAPVYYPADEELELVEEIPAPESVGEPNLEMHPPASEIVDAAAPVARSALRARLRDPARLREAIVVREVLDKPVALRGSMRRPFNDR